MRLCPSNPVVNYLTHKSKIEGSSPTPSTEIEEMDKGLGSARFCLGSTVVGHLTRNSNIKGSSECSERENGKKVLVAQSYALVAQRWYS